MHGVLAADPAVQRDRAVDEHPPEVGRLALVEQVAAGLDRNLGAAVDQLVQLRVGQPGEEGDAPQVVGVHQTVAR